MNDTIGYDAQPLDDFFKAGRRGVRAWAKDREKGASIFLRLGDGERTRLVASILDTWLNEGDLNRAMASGALRHAWDSEPYTDGMRIGSYITSAAELLEDGALFGVEEFINDWGASLMSEAEEREFNAMEFPLTVYRGGTGPSNLVAIGVSWTLKREIASFYAHEWQQSWGSTKEGVIVSAKVDEDEAFAFLNGRSEAEILVPDPECLNEITFHSS